MTNAAAGELAAMLTANVFGMPRSTTLRVCRSSRASDTFPSWYIPKTIDLPSGEYAGVRSVSLGSRWYGSRVQTPVARSIVYSAPSIFGPVWLVTRCRPSGCQLKPPSHPGLQLEIVRASPPTAGISSRLHLSFGPIRVNAISRPFGDHAGIVSSTPVSGLVSWRGGTGAVVCTIRDAVAPLSMAPTYAL